MYAIRSYYGYALAFIRAVYLVRLGLLVRQVHLVCRASHRAARCQEHPRSLGSLVHRDRLGHRGRLVLQVRLVRLGLLVFSYNFV